ncbi:hypothetical protein Clacol_001232 [Clathrus columnatus]|uniref:Uncharacterized protein n=1 Tax=Clathrus columnatus TaxID=1419009 RepID=A0AAV4ZXW6_9AGAM|nr:hypothetical protein Clacol_001232 [Clathrus columnatus]
MSTLENKVVLIIGGSSGIGFGVAEASLKSLAKTVLIASSNQNHVNNAVERLINAKLGPGQINGHVVDAGNEQSIKTLLESVGEVDHIVFTSGLSYSTLKFPGLDISKAKEIMDLRIWSAIAIAKYAKFRPGGSLTLTTGTMAIKPVPTLSVITASGGAVHSLIKGLAIDLAPIRVNVICPGPLFDRLEKEAQDILWNEIIPKLLVKHVGMPNEVAEAYLFCMKCTFITGQCIVVDGGQILS